MRISTEINDPGYATYGEILGSGRKVDVYLDGQPVYGCVTADEQQSYVVACRKDPETGQLVVDPLNPNQIALEKHNGVVQIRYRREWPRWPGRRRRWGDGDRYWGPFTYNPSSAYRGIVLELRSAGEEEQCDDGGRGGASLHLGMGRRHLIMTLPWWLLRPARRWVPWRHERPLASGGLGYWEYTKRAFGFSLGSAGRVRDGGGEVYDFLSVVYGAQTMDSSTDKTWSWFLPWHQWRHVRKSYYGLRGEHWYTEPQPPPRFGSVTDEWRRKAVNAVPVRYFAFLDADGEHGVCRCRIEESEWHRGEGWFKWLSWFYKPIVQRSLDLWFSIETGTRKGSWKGGTIGTAIGMLPDEKHTDAFARHCTMTGKQFLFEVEYRKEDWQRYGERVA